MPKRTEPTSTAAWQRSLVAYIAGHPDRPLKARALARELHIPPSDYTTFRQLVRQLLNNGTLVPGPGRTLKLPQQTGLVVGTFRPTPRGFGFIERPGQPAVYVPRRRTGAARDGDQVAGRLIKPRKRTPGPRAEVVRIIARAPQRWVGILEPTGSTGLVRPQARQPLPAVLIANPTAHSTRPGDLVIVEPLDDAPGPGPVNGQIVERLGDPNDARNQIRGVLQRRAIPVEFPPAVRQAARRAAARFDPERHAGREDLRHLLTVTIDPPDARDFDDAISLERLERGHVRLGVHIADVTHFVPPDGPVDREAQRRGTSVYFPSAVVPMLPEVLSSDVCSLRPGQPRFAKTVLLDYDQREQVVTAHFTNSIIRSDARLTYEQVSTALERGSADVTPDVRALLHDAQKLARRIRTRRLHNGMITLSLPDVKIHVNEQGRVTDAHPADTSFAHTIIEMFMVEANEAVSRHLTRAGLPHLRRIHPQPDPADTENLAQLAPILGRPPPKRLTRENLIRLLDAVRDRPEEAAVSYILLRSLPQAAYSPSDEGHFALASEDYCHFTSPIRRYPDITVHRALDTLTAGGATRKRKRTTPAATTDFELADLGGRMSTAERRAQQAERDAAAALQLMLARTRLGEVCDGMVTGVTSFGVYVQLRPTMAEGFLRVGDFGPGPWRFCRQPAMFIGPSTRRLVYIGHQLRVRIAAIDEPRRRICLLPANKGPIGQVRRDLAKLIPTDRSPRTQRTT